MRLFVNKETKFDIVYSPLKHRLTENTIKTNNGNKITRQLPKYLIGIIIFFFVFYKAGFAKTFNVIISANLSILLLAFIAFTLVPIIMSLRWKNFLDLVSNQPIKIIFSLKMIFIGLFFAEFTPGRIGDISRVYIAKVRGNIPLSKSLPMFIAERLLDLGIITMLALPIFLVIPEAAQLTNESLDQIFFPTILIVIFLSSVLFYSLLKPGIFSGILGFFIRNTFRRINTFKKIETNAANIHNNCSKSLIEFTKNKRIILTNVFLSIVIWLLHIFRIYLISLSLGGNIDLKYFLFIVPVTYMLAIVPITIGGLGIMELGAAALYTLSGMPIEISIAIPLVDRILTAPFYVLVGYILSVREFKDILNKNIY